MNFAMKSIVNATLWVLLVLSTLAIAYHGFNYLDFEVKNILFDKGELVHRTIYRMGFYSHVIFGPIALLIGPWQFMQRFRNRNIRLHRLLGKIYVASCLLSGIAGLYIAQFASTGIIARLGFTTLAILWLFTTTKAFTSIRQKQVTAHQIWMIRSFALTLAAVTLRIQLGVSVASGIEFATAYPIISWMCWVPNLLLAELIWVQKLRRITFA